MTLIGILYISAVTVAISACIPQVIQLLRVRRSDEFELSTWSLWLATQFVGLMYVVSLGDILMIVANIAWISFYGVMVYLIIHYRYIRQPVQEEVAEIKT